MRRLLLLALLASPALGAETLRFWNLTGATIDSLALAPEGSAAFGANQCANDKDGSVDNDERLTLSGIQPGRYDVRVGFKGGRMCTIRSVTVRGSGKYAFSLEPSDLKDCN
ncbi:MAG: hypothetical protein M3N26_03910 [Pseudomonadota bacterium]|nr:hypothetical protein [Pseudomonadota bacterium]